MNTSSAKLAETVGAEGERIRIEVEYFNLGTERITGRIVFDDPDNTPVLEFTAFNGDVERLTHGFHHVIAMIKKAVA